MSAATIDKALDGKQTNNFVVVSANEIVDQDGRHFSPGNIAGYIAKVKPVKKAAYVFWVTDKSEVQVAKNVISVFADYGATVFVIRDAKKPDKSEVKATDETTKQKTVIIVGQPNPHALSATDKVPDMAGRPVILRPGKLPRRVRYQFQPDAVVIAAAERVTKLLLGAPPVDSAAVFKEQVMLAPGAWTRLKNVPSLADTKPFISNCEFRNQVLKLEGRIVGKPEQFATAINEIRQLIAADGGGTVRAFTSDEMQAWWTFIGFDIEEPTFVLETKGGMYRFIIDDLDGHLFLIDELNALPAQ